MKQLFFLILPTLLIIFTNSLAKKITVITQVVDGYPVLSPDGINITFPHIYEKELAEEIPETKTLSIPGLPGHMWQILLLYHSPKKVATINVASTLAKLDGIKFSRKIDGRALIKSKTS